jgi:hypothetical protein
MRFEVALSMVTAKALGLEISPSRLVQADDVVK